MGNSFVSWSGGKDALFALFLELEKNKNLGEVTLINMCEVNGVKSRSHNISSSIIKEQAKAMGVKIEQGFSSRENYEEVFKGIITSLKENRGVVRGIFGDIYLQAHRDWIERVCSECGVNAVFPLWNMNTKDIVNQFILAGFSTKIVAVNRDKLSSTFIGRDIDSQLIKDLPKDIDPCGELGEFHTFVYDGPIFNYSLLNEIISEIASNREWY